MGKRLILILALLMPTIAIGQYLKLVPESALSPPFDLDEKVMLECGDTWIEVDVKNNRIQYAKNSRRSHNLIFDHKTSIGWLEDRGDHFWLRVITRSSGNLKTYLIIPSIDWDRTKNEGIIQTTQCRVAVFN